MTARSSGISEIRAVIDRAYSQASTTEPTCKARGARGGYIQTSALPNGIAPSGPAFLTGCRRETAETPRTQGEAAARVLDSTLRRARRAQRSIRERIARCSRQTGGNANLDAVVQFVCRAITLP